MTSSSKKPRPETIECTTCYGSGVCTTRSVDGEDIEACWKCEGVGWITQLPHAAGPSIDSPTMPSPGEISRAKVRGDGMKAEHVATLPNEVLWGWPDSRDSLERWLWDRHYGRTGYEALVRGLTLPDCRAALRCFEKHERENAEELKKLPLHHVAQGIRDALVARLQGGVS